MARTLSLDYDTRMRLERIVAPHMTRRALLVVIVLIIYNIVASEISLHDPPPLEWSIFLENPIFSIFTRKTNGFYTFSLFFHIVVFTTSIFTRVRVRTGITNGFWRVFLSLVCSFMNYQCFLTISKMRCGVCAVLNRQELFFGLMLFCTFFFCE